MNGRVLSEGNIGFYERTHEVLPQSDLVQAVKDLIVTIRDRDHEIKKRNNVIRGLTEDMRRLEQQNNLMLSALEQIRERINGAHDGFIINDMVAIARHAITQIKGGDS